MSLPLEERMDQIVLRPEEIRECIIELGAKISADYVDKQGEGVVVLGVLKGAAAFTMDLVRRLSIDVELEFLSISSYKNSTKSSGKVDINRDVLCDIEGKHIIIVEDIIDSGLTLYYLRKYLNERHPASVRFATLLHKHKDECKIDIDYKAFDCPDGFVVGYGIDYAQHYRGLPYVGIFRPQCYND